ncbi:type IV pilin protein [Neisseria animalis]|nr:type IV pilin protein [Neisseria animalis]VEE09581.1 pilin [Neisseria animalis]
MKRPAPQHRNRGFSLIQLLAATAVLAVLAATALPAYDRHIRDSRLREAQAALLENTQYLEKYYLQNGRIRRNTANWPDLPLTQTDTFCIRFSSQARGQTENREGKFTLKAVAFDKNREPRVLKINESLTTLICQSSDSRCDDGLPHFPGNSDNDKECTVFQH